MKKDIEDYRHIRIHYGYKDINGRPLWAVRGRCFVDVRVSPKYLRRVEIGTIRQDLDCFRATLKNTKAVRKSFRLVTDQKSNHDC